MAAVHLILPEGLLHEVQEMGIGQLIEAHIKAEIEIGIVGHQPHAGTDSLFKYPAACQMDHIVLFQHGDKDGRRNILAAEFPAQQHFAADGPSVQCGNDGLDHKFSMPHSTSRLRASAILDIYFTRSMLLSE